jgi:hypothetical protein
MMKASPAPRCFARLRIVSRRAWGMSFCPYVYRTKMLKHFGTIDLTFRMSADEKSFIFPGNVKTSAPTQSRRSHAPRQFAPVAILERQTLKPYGNGGGPAPPEFSEAGIRIGAGRSNTRRGDGH